jgi:hypothetical protein
MTIFTRQISPATFTSPILGVNIVLKYLVSLILTYETSAYILLRFLCSYSSPISYLESNAVSLFIFMEYPLSPNLRHKHRQAADISHSISVSYDITEIPNGLCVTLSVTYGFIHLHPRILAFSILKLITFQ